MSKKENSKDQANEEHEIIEINPFDSSKSLKIDFFKGRPYHTSKIETRVCPKCEGTLTYPQAEALKQYLSEDMGEEMRKLLSKKTIDLEDFDREFEERYNFLGPPMSRTIWDAQDKGLPEIRCENCGWEGKTVARLKLEEDPSEPKLIKKDIDVINYLDKCPDCGTYEGMCHTQLPYTHSCLMETCPICEIKVIACECPSNYKFNGNYAQIYDSDGHIIEKKHRYPHIHFRNICVRCGVLSPRLFEYPKEDDKLITPLLKAHFGYANINLSHHICRNCYLEVKDLYNQGLTDQIEAPELCRYCGKTLSAPKKLDKEKEKIFLDEYRRGHMYCEVCFDKINFLIKSATTKEELLENIN